MIAQPKENKERRTMNTPRITKYLSIIVAVTFLFNQMPLALANDGSSLLEETSADNRSNLENSGGAESSVAQRNAVNDLEELNNYDEIDESLLMTQSEFDRALRAYEYDQLYGLTFFANDNDLPNNGLTREKWLRGNVDGEESYFFILPSGTLYRYTGDHALVNSTTHTHHTIDLESQERIGHLHESFNTDISKLVDATEPNSDYITDPVGPTVDEARMAQSAYDLDQSLKLELDQGTDYQNFFGHNERWLLGNGIQWYFILSDGGFYRYDGNDMENSTKLEQFDSTFYDDLSKIYDAQEPADNVRDDMAELASQLNDDFGLYYLGTDLLNWGGRNEKWFAGDSKYFYILEDGSVYEWEGGVLENDSQIATLTTDYYLNTSLLTDALIPRTVNNNESHDAFTSSAIELDRKHNLSHNGNDYLNWGGLNEKWMQGQGRVWFFITSDGSFYKWNGGDLENSEKLAQFDGTYYEDTSKIYNAFSGEFDVPESSSDEDGGLSQYNDIENLADRAHALDHDYDLDHSGNDYLNWGGLNEKWMGNSDGEWFYITPDGWFYQWNGGALSGSTKITKLDPSFYADTSKIYDAMTGDSDSDASTDSEDNGEINGQNHTSGNDDALVSSDVSADLLASYLNQTLDLNHPGSDYFNWGGWNEKWVTGTNGAWYFITSDGSFYHWKGGALTNSEKLTTLDGSFYKDTSKIYNAPHRDIENVGLNHSSENEDSEVSNTLPTIDRLRNIADDMDADREGLQILAGTTQRIDPKGVVDADGDNLYWRWIYKVDGSDNEHVYEEGGPSAVIPSLLYKYEVDSIGKRYEWILEVHDGKSDPVRESLIVDEVVVTINQQADFESQPQADSIAVRLEAGDDDIWIDLEGAFSDHNRHTTADNTYEIVAEPSIGQIDFLNPRGEENFGRIKFSLSDDEMDFVGIVRFNFVVRNTAGLASGLSIMAMSDRSDHSQYKSNMSSVAPERKDIAIDESTLTSYWTNGTAIYKNGPNEDKSEAVHVFSTRSDNLIFDSSSGYLIYTFENGVYRMDPNDVRTHQRIALMTGHVRDIAMDETTGRLFISSGSVISQLDTSQLNMEGVFPTQIPIEGSVDAPFIAVDSSKGKIYWMNDQGPLNRADMDGNNHERLSQVKIPLGMSTAGISGLGVSDERIFVSLNDNGNNRINPEFAQLMSFDKNGENKAVMTRGGDTGLHASISDIEVGDNGMVFYGGWTWSGTGSGSNTSYISITGHEEDYISSNTSAVGTISVIINNGHNESPTDPKDPEEPIIVVNPGEEPLDQGRSQVIICDQRCSESTDFDSLTLLDSDYVSSISQFNVLQGDFTIEVDETKTTDPNLVIVTGNNELSFEPTQDALDSRINDVYVSLRDQQGNHLRLLIKIELRSNLGSELIYDWNYYLLS